jgi:hypothetical protein
LLKLTTELTRLVLPLLVFLVWTPAALAWSWPVHGPVLQPFAYDEAHPYASGQHRGIDIGADAAGETVVAPAAGTVSFAGTVPTSGKSVTIETRDGYAVAEGETVGTIGPSGTPEVDGPYIHLGIRVTADPNGYVDPLGLLHAAPPSSPAPVDSTASQPSAGGGAAAPPATAPTPVVAAGAPPAITRGSTVRRNRTRLSRHRRGRAHESRAEVRRPRSSQRPAAHGGNADARTRHHVATPQPRLSEPTSSSRRPVVETVAPREPTGLDAGHELQPSVRAPQGRSRRPPLFTVLLPLLCNGAAALVALAAALVVGMRRRRRADTRPVEGAQVLHLPRPLLEQRREQRAA